MTASQRAYGGRRTAQGGEVDAQAVIARSMTEKALSQHVVNLARMLGWLVHRDPTWRATGTDAGYPDLTLVKPDVIIFMELKAERGQLSAPQRQWEQAIRECSGSKVPMRSRNIQYWLITPRDWLDGKIEWLLTGAPDDGRPHSTNWRKAY